MTVKCYHQNYILYTRLFSDIVVYIRILSRIVFYSHRWLTNLFKHLNRLEKRVKMKFQISFLLIVGKLVLNTYTF